jgi:hypothetical protein
MDTMTMQDGTQLDPKAVKVMKAIRQVESGGDYNAVGDNGNAKGAFQFNEKSGPGWKNLAKQYLGDENATFDKGNQNKVAYSRIKQWKDEGKQPEEIAALWNGAKKDTNGKYTYNNPEYGQKFRTALSGDQGKYSYQSSKDTQPVTDNQKPGGVQGFVQGLTSLPLSLVSSGNALLHSGDQQGYDKIQKEGTDFGYFGKVKPVGAGFDVTKGVSDNLGAIGDAAKTGGEIAATMIGGKLATGLLGKILGSSKLLSDPIVKTALESVAGGSKGVAQLTTKGSIYNALTTAMENAGPYEKTIIDKARQELINPSSSLLQKTLKGTGKLALDAAKVWGAKEIWGSGTSQVKGLLNRN